MRSGTARGLNRDQIVKIARLTGCENFVGKRKKVICLLITDKGSWTKSKDRIKAYLTKVRTKCELHTHCSQNK